MAGDDPDLKLGQECFIVRDANGQALAYVYFEEEPGLASRRADRALRMLRTRAERTPQPAFCWGMWPEGHSFRRSIRLCSGRAG